MKTPAWHSTQSSDPNVYHDNDCCLFGNHVNVNKRTFGTNDRPKCPGCDQLNGDETETSSIKSNGVPFPQPIDSFYQGWE